MPVSATEVPSGVPLGRLEKLTKGINLSHWFSQSNNYSNQHLDTYDTARDAVLIKSLGFHHVRFTFNDATVVDRENPAVLNAQKMKRFDAAMDMLLAANLAVIVDFHPEDEYKKAVEKDNVALANFVGMWRALARHLSSRDPEKVFLEVMNEPVMRDSARWNEIQKKVLRAMRESAPRHTLIASSTEWSEIYKLELVEVVSDRNVVYNFHCYEPFKFTHQNAPWVGELTKGLKNAPYPSNLEAVNKILADLPDEKAKRLMIQYGNENWNARKIDAFIAHAAAWGKKHNVALTCNEFGVIRTAPAADRNRCIEDVRKALEKHNIGWCMWDYAGGFGVATGKPGERVADPNTVKALGLTPARQEAVVAKHKAVFTVPPQKIPSDNSVDAPLLGNGDTLAALGGTPDRLRFYINKNDLWIMRAAKGSQPIPLARLELDFPGMQGATYRVEQDLQQAITVGRFTKAGVTLSLETGMAATENLLWIKLSAEGGALQGRAGLYLPGQDAAATGDVPMVERRFEQDVLVPAGAACALRVVGGGREFTVTPEKPVLIVAAVCSRFDQPEFRQAAVRRANELGPEVLDRVRAEHVAWWRQFWAKSFVEIPDKVLEQRYYLSHYVMASASRVYDFPPGLFGWITTDKPSWYGDYHLNYNHVAPFYGLYAANHIEQADPCHGPLLASADQARALCRAKLGIEGLFQYVGIGPKGSVAFDVALMQKSNSSYSCVPLACRWYATYDLDYARLAYPFVRDTATFWENWLKWETNRYVIYKDAVHEDSGDNVNPIVSLAFVHIVMDLALDMSRELGVDAARHEKWQHIRDNLSAFPVCRLRDLPEQFWPKHLPHTDDILDLPIFRYTEQGTPWWADNTVGIQHIFPAGAIGLDSPPEQLQRARNQIKVMNRWVDFNGMNSFYAAAARVGYDPTVILKEMRSMIDSIGAPNGMIPSNPHGMEHQSIVPNAIQEMLLQSHEGVLRFFPCWPKEQNARFGTLRARGAFLVSAELKSGQVQYVKIHSEKGRPCTLVNPWPGKSVRVIRSGKSAESLSGDRFVLKTGGGETIEIEPQGT